MINIEVKFKVGEFLVTRDRLAMGRVVRIQINITSEKPISIDYCLEANYASSWQREDRLERLNLEDKK